MKVIIDGCDLTGKTTLIKKLKEYYNNDKISYLHFSYNDRTDYDFYNTMLDKNNFIADRHFLDEMIYPSIFNRPGKLSYESFLKLLNKCNEENIKIIILTTSLDNLLKRLSERKNEENEVIDNLRLINSKFIYMASAYNLKLIDTTQVTFEEIIDYIESENKYEKYKSNVLK